MAKTQRDAVIEVIVNRGGYAKLGDLYQYALKVPGVHWGTKTPFASIRRIVQTDPQFFKVQPGLWALEAYRDKLPFKEQAEDGTPIKLREAFNHSYFQGLLVEIGNFKRLSTYVPPQDKNQLFLDKPLYTVATVKHLYSFSYDSIVRSAKTVDVIWFNQRNMPSAFIEVEHSTDIYNSLRKFNELQDFYAEFTIVAPEARQAEFEDKRNSSAYGDMRSRVKFWGYEQVSKVHGHLSELAAMAYLP